MTSSLAYFPYGDQAVLIKIDHQDIMTANKTVIAIVHFLEARGYSFIYELVPATNSIVIIYDIHRIKYEQLVELLKNELIDLKSIPINPQLVELPICYDSTLALDLEAVCRQTGLSSDEIIKIHLDTTYQVMMTGFMPGFIYLGQLPEQIDISRRAVPRTKVPKESVAVAGRQTGIYSVACPGGWQIIGKSVNLLNMILQKKLSISLGDQVKFYAVSKAALAKIAGQ